MIPFKPGANEIRQGCRFCPRCEFAMEICSRKEPPLREKENGHKIRCWLHQEEEEDGLDG